MDAKQGRRTVVVGTLARRSGVFTWALCLALGSLMIGLMSGCVVPLEEPTARSPGIATAGPYVPDQQALMRYIRGQTDELPPGLPPAQAEIWKQSRKQVQQSAGVAEIQGEDRADEVIAEYQQEAFLRLPEGYSEAIADAKIPRPVLATARSTASFGAGLGAAAEGTGKAWETKLGASKALAQEADKKARISVMRALLAEKTFQRILPTEDPESPLVTDDALFLHVHMHDTFGSAALVACKGSLRDRAGKKGVFEFTFTVSVDYSGAQTAPERSLQTQERRDARFRAGLVPAIMEAYANMK